jgi:hypothetical protein
MAKNGAAGTSPGRRSASQGTLAAGAHPRERRPHHRHSASEGSGSTMNQCSSTASAMSVPSKVKPAARKAPASGAEAAPNSRAQAMVEPVTEKGNSAFAGRRRKKLRRCRRWSGRNDSAKLRTPRNTLSFALSRMVQRTRKVPAPIWFGPPQVRPATSAAPARIANSCHRTAPSAATKRGQPLLPGSRGALRGPVSQPVRKLISTQPQTSRAQVKAR